MNSRHGWILFTIFGAVAAGCAGGKTLTRSEAQAQAATQLERGIRAQQRGETARSESCLVASLKISSSIEDNPARIAALINLARLNRLNNNPGAAALHIDQALKLAADLPGFMAEAAYEKALIELAQNHFREALAWAEQSLSSDNSGEKGRRLNLLARIHLSSGNRNEAASFAGKAREESRSNGDACEEANSLRLLGSLERLDRRFVEAEKLLGESLAIDKQNGDSHKIALDLEELAANAHDKGDSKIEIEYLERAFSVHMNGSRADKAALNQLKIAEIYRTSGNTALADKAAKVAAELMKGNSTYHKSSSESASPSSRP